MKSDNAIDLNDCTELRQVLQMRTPGILHATTLLSITLLTVALAWMWLTKANLVVVGAGRVRPITELDSEEEFSEEISSVLGGRIVEVNATIGKHARAGDILVRLDTAELELQNEMLQEQVRSGREKITQLERSAKLLASRYEAALQKGDAELKEAETELQLAARRQTSDIELARNSWEALKARTARLRKLVAKRAASQQQLDEAIAKQREAEEKLRQAKVPLNDSKAEVLRKNLELTRRDYELEKQKLAVELRSRQDEVSNATYQLKGLQRQLAQSAIVAPADCIITKADVKVGDVVKAGKIGITTASQRGLEFEVQVAAADVAHLKPNMPVQIKLDAYDYQKYGILPGSVRLVAPDSTLERMGDGAQAAIYRVKITLATDEIRRGEHLGQVKLGMTGTAEIVTGTESVLAILLRKMHQKISLG